MHDTFFQLYDCTQTDFRFAGTSDLHWEPDYGSHITTTGVSLDLFLAHQLSSPSLFQHGVNDVIVFHLKLHA